MITLSHINTMSSADFEKAFGDVAEHSPWVARNAAGAAAIQIAARP